MRFKLSFQILMIAIAFAWLALPLRAADQTSELTLVFDKAAAPAITAKHDGTHGHLSELIERGSNVWHLVEFDEVQEIKRIEIVFEDADKGHAYIIEFSIEGSLWYPCGGLKEAVAQSPHVQALDIRAKYLRVRATQGNPELQDVKVYGGASVNVADLPDHGYILSYFIDKGHSGLHLSWSRDGLTWQALNRGRSFLKSPLVSKLMRDPHLTWGPDGMIHLVWTIPRSPWGIGYSSSTNLIDWSEPRILPVMKSEPTVENCWAPETFYDAATDQFIIVWASTIPGRFPETDLPPDHPKKHHQNHRHYYVTTRDFVTLSEPQLFFDPGYNSIDATLLKRGDKYYMVFKDEQIDPVRKLLLAAVGESATGPFEVIGVPFTKTWSEGASLIEMGDEVYCYYDYYGVHRYGLARTKDFLKWEDISNKLVGMPQGMHHASIITAPRSLLEALIALEKNRK